MENFLGLQTAFPIDKGGEIVEKTIELEVVEPSEPSDVIYENLEISEQQVKRNEKVMYAVLAISVLLAFFLFTYLKVKTGENAIKYPPSLNCDPIYQLFF